MEGGIEKKKFEDMKRALDERNYDIVKSIGKGAFGEVMLARNSTFGLICRKGWAICRKNNKQDAFEEEAIPLKIH